MTVSQSRLEQVRKTEKTLRSLLRTPKTRSGLVAAVTAGEISRNFIFGWLSEQVRMGNVVKFKSTQPPTYQLSGHVITETPTAGQFPNWLEPRALPDATARRVYLDGCEVNQNKNKKKT